MKKHALPEFWAALPQEPHHGGHHTHRVGGWARGVGQESIQGG